MSRIPIPIPEPILTGEFLARHDGRHILLGKAERGDEFDLTTGECRVARVIRGIRYDTAKAILVVGSSALELADGFSLQRLYRAEHLAWFLLRMEWWDGIGFRNEDFIRPVPDEHVLHRVRGIIRTADALHFLLDWYCGGWIPRNDRYARSWAEEALSADDCEIVLDAIDTLGPV
ncbi:MAG: hypothetical protein ACREP2_05010 [Rhodanobacteraceae bacterium]